MKTKKKKRSSSQNFYEIRCESKKITKIRAVNTNLRVLGLDLHSNSPEPVNFFGAQSLLGEAQFSFGEHKQSFGGHGPGMLSVVPGLCQGPLFTTTTLAITTTFAKTTTFIKTTTVVKTTTFITIITFFVIWSIFFNCFKVFFTFVLCAFCSASNSVFFTLRSNTNRFGAKFLVR